MLYVFLYIFYRAGVALWFLGALAISCILFGLVLPFDREYSYRGHNFALHHVPEVERGKNSTPSHHIPAGFCRKTSPGLVKESAAI